MNLTTGNGETVLMWTSDIEMVRLLLEAGADVNAKTKDGETALSIARRYGYGHITELLEKALQK